jgi:hypothetical protein
LLPELNDEEAVLKRGFADGQWISAFDYKMPFKASERYFPCTEFTFGAAGGQRPLTRDRKLASIQANFDAIRFYSRYRHDHPKSFNGFNHINGRLPARTPSLHSAIVGAHSDLEKISLNAFSLLQERVCALPNQYIPVLGRHIAPVFYRTKLSR